MTISPRVVLVFGPIIEDRPPVKPDHIRHLPGKGLGTTLGEAATGEKAQQVEFGFAGHPVEHLVIGKIINPNDDALAERAEIIRKSRISRVGKRLEIGKRRRYEIWPIDRYQSSPRDLRRMRI